MCLAKPTHAMCQVVGQRLGGFCDTGGEPPPHTFSTLLLTLPRARMFNAGKRTGREVRIRWGCAALPWDGATIALRYSPSVAHWARAGRRQGREEGTDGGADRG